MLTAQYLTNFPCMGVILHRKHVTDSTLTFSLDLD